MLLLSKLFTTFSDLFLKIFTFNLNLLILLISLLYTLFKNTPFVEIDSAILYKFTSLISF